MHIKKIDVRNVKTLASFVWELTPGDSVSGWHVFLGDNGAGKSTLLRCCATALMGQKNAIGLRLPWVDWIRQGEAEAKITLTVSQASGWDQWAGQGKTTAGDLKLGVKIGSSGLEAMEHSPSPNRHVWGGSGWFSASFGPYRRFSGGSKEYEKLFYSMPKLASHLSIFGEDVALSETLTWLRELHYQQLDDEKRGLQISQATILLQHVKQFINQEGFLPNGVTLEEIGPRGIVFLDQSRMPIEIVNLSDGFRSILSMTLELIRQLASTFGSDKIFNEDSSNIVLPGVVIIDEIDVHLHPKWQRAIGPWLTGHFPNIQFLVTTHSPLVCQGAIRGSVTRLPILGTDNVGGRITGIELNRLLYGDILEALSSGAFGEGIDRSNLAQEMLIELATLNVKSRHQDLNETEVGRRRELQSIFGSVSDTTEGISDA